ncbi:MAG: hypothetical protein HYX26_08325 [Acidobacteriales bacterium]|nr:hypothetical protein [Terriglobales bacterium]
MPDHKANADRQNRGAELLQTQLPGFYLPSKSEKKKLLEILGISKRFQQTFDAIRLNVPTFADVRNAKDFDLLEIKTTDKHLPNLPQGFFFGMTENEEMLLKVFEGKYFLCLVCAHPKSLGYELVDWGQLETLTQNKRVQYQINLKSKS